MAYKLYRYRRQDPMVKRVLIALETSGLTISASAEESGMAANTLNRWKTGKTRSPRHESLARTAMSAGYEFRLVKSPTNG
jgi:transcriptional regulator with XRE-family HTH domain